MKLYFLRYDHPNSLSLSCRKSRAFDKALIKSCFKKIVYVKIGTYKVICKTLTALYNKKWLANRVTTTINICNYQKHFIVQKYHVNIKYLSFQDYKEQQKNICLPLHCTKTHKLLPWNYIFTMLSDITKTINLIWENLRTATAVLSDRFICVFLKQVCFHSSMQ